MKMIVNIVFFRYTGFTAVRIKIWSYAERIPVNRKDSS